HEPIARLEGSTLRYLDQVLPVADLGGAKEPGWAERDELPERPDVDNPRIREQRTRHIRREQEEADAESNGRVAREQYEQLLGRVRLMARSAVPPDSTV